MIVVIATWLLAAVTRELTLFAAVGLLIGGIDDVVVDLIWAGRALWRTLVIHRRRPPPTAATLLPPARSGRMAIFIACWHEANVIGDTLRKALSALDHSDYRIFVGTYPNDPETIAEIKAVRDPRVRMVGGVVPGPTTKAECLNRLWAALRLDERNAGVPFKAVVLHDAEDEPHPDELKVFDNLIERYDLVQLPVLPKIRKHSRWASLISGHYADEFAEAHGRQMAVRSAVGAGIPSAGVACAIARRVMVAMARERGGAPFDETSVTEDYEMGLNLAGYGGRAAFVAMRAGPRQPLVATRAYFPHEFEAAVRQKSRWMTGIALAGWDRLRWRGGIAETWMRLRDRRAVLAALVLTVSYLSLCCAGLCLLFGVRPPYPAWGVRLLDIVLYLLGWRLALRGMTVAYYYGWREGLLALPRVLVANAIAMAAAQRALVSYVPGVTPCWDKTNHYFAEAAPCD